MVWLARYVEEFLQCCSCTHNFWPPPPDEDVVGTHVLLFSLQFCEREPLLCCCKAVSGRRVAVVFFPSSFLPPAQMDCR